MTKLYHIKLCVSCGQGQAQTSESTVLHCSVLAITSLLSVFSGFSVCFVQLLELLFEKTVGFLSCIFEIFIAGRVQVLKMKEKLLLC